MGQPTNEEGARWRALLVEQKESGQSIVGFCRERALPVWQFYEWRKRLRPAEASSFVAVEISTTETPAALLPTAPVPSAPIEVRLSRGRSLLVGPDFEVNHLRRLLTVLEQEP
jgi:hypothetical protein